MDLRWLLSEALVAGTVPETLTKEKQGKLIINKSNCEQDNCGSVVCGLQPNRSRGIDNSKHVDNLEELDIIKGGLDLKPTKLEHIFVAVITFFTLSFVQILLIPACCLLCVL